MNALRLGAGGSAGGAAAGGAAVVEDVGALCRELGAVEGLGTGEADLLADGEEDLHRAVGEIVFLDRAHGFKDRGDAALVVAAEDGRAVGVDRAVADLGLDAAAGETVSMCALSMMGSLVSVPGKRAKTLPPSDAQGMPASSISASRPSASSFSFSTRAMLPSWWVSESIWISSRNSSSRRCSFIIKMSFLCKVFGVFPRLSYPCRGQKASARMKKKKLKKFEKKH